MKKKGLRNTTIAFKNAVNKHYYIDSIKKEKKKNSMFSEKKIERYKKKLEEHEKNVKLEGLVFIFGKTYEKKEKLKKIGWRFSSQSKKWYSDIEDNLDSLEMIAVEG